MTSIPLEIVEVDHDSNVTPGDDIVDRDGRMMGVIRPVTPGVTPSRQPSRIGSCGTRVSGVPLGGGVSSVEGSARSISSHSGSADQRLGDP